MTIILQIADAVVAALNADTFSQEFDAKRYYQPLFELKDLKVLKVSVVPRGLSIVQAARDKTAQDYQIDVAVQKKFSKGDNPELDPLMDLVEEIADFFRFKRLPEFPEAVWVKTENAPVYSPEHMDQFRQFTSVVTFSFRVVR